MEQHTDEGDAMTKVRAVPVSPDKYLEAAWTKAMRDDPGFKIAQQPDVTKLFTPCGGDYTLDAPGGRTVCITLLGDFAHKRKALPTNGSEEQMDGWAATVTASAPGLTSKGDALLLTLEDALQLAFTQAICGILAALSHQMRQG